MKKDDLIGAKEKEADIYFSDGLKNEQSCEADIIYRFGME